MDSIKISIKLPSSSELKSDLNSLLTQVQGKTSLNLDLDISTFKSSISEVSQLLGKLKTQVASLGGFETLINTNMVKESTKAIQEQNNAIKEQQKLIDSKVLKTSNTKMVSSSGEDVLIKDLEQIKDEYGNIIEVVNKYDTKTGEITSTIVKTTNEIEKQRLANEKLLESTEKVKSVMQSRLNESISNKNFSLIDDSVFTALQHKINSINTETPEREIRELQNALKNLNNSDGQIVRLQNAISKYETKIDGLKEKYKNLVPKNELNEAIDKISELKSVLSQVQSNEGIFTNKAISNTLNEASTSMNKLGTATKIASENQRLYNKEVISFSSAFKDVATKVGLFSIVYGAMNKIQSTFREGFQSIVDMDTALTDLNKVVDLSSSQLLQMRDNAVAMGEALGRSSVDVAKAQAEFGRQYKNISDINEMTRVSILGANVMDGTSADQVAKGLTTIINSLKLESKDAISIIDSLNEVQNNFRVESSQMLDALGKVGSTANVAGASLQELEGYITSLTVASGKTGDEVGESLKSITSRIYKIGSEGIESEGKPEKMLKEMGVAVRDIEGNFRPLNEILSDLSVKWKVMTDTQKIATAQVVAGQHKYNDFISLLNNFDMATEATAYAMNSVGSAVEENEKYIGSIQGKMESLKATMQGFFLDFISSDMIKGGVDALQSLMNVLNGLQGTFGSLGLSVGVLSSAFLVFTNNPLKQLSQDIVMHKTTLGGLSDIYNKIKYAITETGTSMNIAQKSSLALRTGFTQLGNSAIFAQIKVIALQTALSLGLGFALTLIVSGIGKLIASLDMSSKSMKNVESQANTLANSLDSISKERDLSNQYEEITNQLKNANLEENKRNELKSQLDSVMKDLIASEQGYYGILNNENLTLDEQLQKMEQIRQLKLFDEAKELDEDMMSQGDIETKVKRLKEYVQTYNDIQSALKIGSETGNYQKLIDLIGVSDIDEANQILKDTKNNINELDGEILQYNSSVKLMNDSNYETSRSTIELDGKTNKFIDSLNKATDATKENTKAKQDNANTQSDAPVSVEEASKTYASVTKEITNMQNALKELGDMQEMSAEMATSLLEKYPQMGASVFSVAEAQEFLNSKIEEQAIEQQKAYEIMISNSENWYQKNIANNDEMANAVRNFAKTFVDEQGNAYDIDVKNYKTLAELKNAMNGDLIDGIANFLKTLVGGSSDAYARDLRNCKTWAEQKALIIAKISAQIDKAENQLRVHLTNIQKVDSSKNSDSLVDEKLYKNTQAELDKLNSAKTQIETTFNEFGAVFDKGISGIHGGSLSSVGSGGSNKDKTEKEIANMEKLSDRYRDVNNALKELDNELDRNKILMENTSDEEKLKYLEKELELIKKQEVAYKNKNKEQQKELSERKNSLIANGFNADGSGRITNANSRLDALTNWANSLSGDAKENAQKNVKAIAESLERYNDLLLNQIPEVSNAILDLKNTTIDTQKEIVDIIKKQKDTYIDNIEKETDALKKAIQKRKEMRSQEWAEEDYADELKSRQDTLVDLESQLQDAMRMADGELIANIKKQIESAQQDINNFIRDNERDKADQRYDGELEKIDEDAQKKIDEITNKLTDEEILKMVQNGVRDLTSILDSIGGANKNVATTFATIDTNISNMRTNLSEVLKDLQSISVIDLNLNANVNGNVKTSSKQPIEVKFENTYIIEESENGVTMKDVEKVVKKSQDDTIRKFAEISGIK